MKAPPHIQIPWITRPAICALSVVAGFGVGDGWLLVTGLLAAWFIDAKPWDPYRDGGIVDHPKREDKA